MEDLISHDPDLATARSAPPGQRADPEGPAANSLDRRKIQSERNSPRPCRGRDREPRSRTGGGSGGGHESDVSGFAISHCGKGPSRFSRPRTKRQPTIQARRKICTRSGLVFGPHATVEGDGTCVPRDGNTGGLPMKAIPLPLRVFFVFTCRGTALAGCIFPPRNRQADRRSRLRAWTPPARWAGLIEGAKRQDLGRSPTRDRLTSQPPDARHPHGPRRLSPDIGDDLRHPKNVRP